MRPMKRILIPAVVLICAAARTLPAQDPVQVAPHNFTVLLENASVRVLDFHSKSGDKIPMHAHPAYVTYSLSGSGKTVFTAPDGKTPEQPSKTGQVRWHDAETHATEYIGTGGAHVLLVELKAQPPSKPKP